MGESKSNPIQVHAEAKTRRDRIEGIVIAVLIAMLYPGRKRVRGK